MSFPEPPMMAAAACVTLPTAFNINDDAEVPVVMAALIKILFAAVRVKEFPDDQETGSTTVIFPAPVPLAFVVVTITFDVPSAVVRLPVVNKESCMLPDDAKVSGLPPLPVSALESVPVMPAVVAFA